MAERCTQDLLYESSPRSFVCWFKNRLPPSPTLQAGFQLWMLGKTSEIRNRGDVKSWQSTCQQVLSLPGAYPQGPHPGRGIDGEPVADIRSHRCHRCVSADDI